MLTGEELERFVADGYLPLRGAFAPEIADRVLPFVWSELGLSPDRPGEWSERALIVREVIAEGTAREMLTERYRLAVDELAGAGRWGTTDGVGHFPVSFPGFAAAPWRPIRRAWHVDGNATPHRLERPSRGLVGLELLTDVAPGSGGTAIRVGSHRTTARVLAAAGPPGLDEVELNRRSEGASAGLPVVEAHGRAGDVILLHPWTVHGASTNTGTSARIMANRPFWLREPVDLEDPVTPVERAIAEAIEEDSRRRRWTVLGRR